MNLGPEDREVLLDLQRQASEPYSAFVFDTDADADEFWRLLFERGVVEFSPPHGRLAREGGRIVGMMACLGQRELRAMRLRSAAELGKAAFFRARADAQRRMQMAGRALITVQPADYYLSRLAVIADRRRHGVGGRLIAEFEAEGRRRGCTRLTLEVSADNPAALRFYESCGFVQIGRSAVGDAATGRKLEYLHMAKPIA